MHQEILLTLSSKHIYRPQLLTTSAVNTMTNPLPSPPGVIKLTGLSASLLTPPQAILKQAAMVVLLSYPLAPHFSLDKTQLIYLSCSHVILASLKFLENARHVPPLPQGICSNVTTSMRPIWPTYLNCKLFFNTHSLTLVIAFILLLSPTKHLFPSTMPDSFLFFFSFG